MKKSCLFLAIVLLPFFGFAQEDTKTYFEYISFSVLYNENGESKFKPSEELIQSMSRKAKIEGREINEELYYAKDVNKNMELLGKEGYELVTSSSIKISDGTNVTFYFKRKVVSK